MNSKHQFWWKPCKAEIYCFLHFHQGHKGNERNIQTKPSSGAEEVTPLATPLLSALPLCVPFLGFTPTSGGGVSLPNPFSLDDYSSTDTGTLTINTY